MFRKILIANRGEIACRVIATARRLGIGTVAVYSDADRHARHVRLADEAVRIGPAPARESYLNVAAILEAARRTGAEAIHPGYGFLSENAAFAEACDAAGVVFIGPAPAAIRAMGDKAHAKALMAQAGVPLIPGYHGEDQSPERLLAEADAIGYPVLIKAAAGGGGKGMRLVAGRSDFAAALAACQREALAAFGDARVLIERAVVSTRHVEVQVFADTHGNVVYLYERDCSAQRRHQKVLEEAPAPGLSAEERRAMGEAAVAAARAVGYVGAGTVEFLRAPDGAFYFMEMNTRLQVEHPVTEMITGLDLVEWQLRVAAGEPLPLRQGQSTCRGHAMEARIYAEDPDKDFLPATGRLDVLVFPAQGNGVRVDTGVEQGDEITPYYDPMIAKLIVWGETRETARRRMETALAATRIVGVANNVAFLLRLVACPAFRDARLSTDLIAREAEWLLGARALPEAAWWVVTLAAWLEDEAAARAAAAASGDPTSPWHDRSGWRLNAPATRRWRWRSGGVTSLVAVSPQGGALHLARWVLDDAAGKDSGATRGNALTPSDEAGSEAARGGGVAELRASASPPDAPVAETIARAERLTDGAIAFELSGWRGRAEVIAQGERRYVFLPEGAFVFEALAESFATGSGGDAAGTVAAPMPGRVLAVHVRGGERVRAGAPLVTLEAMKMEHTLSAAADALVKAVLVAPGAQVSDGDVLLELEAVAQS